jgi:NADH:ubiquinone oxidoreductase subunit F (NADH-binding)
LAVISETRITLKNLGKTDPLSIDDYIEAGGYKALEKALLKDNSEIIDEMIKSSLRGRGGAGFPAGLKEKFTSEACKRCAGRYLICNADEGEPGTFKDRVIMENDPHLLIEGMLIAAWAIQATMCYIYIRAEYYESIKKLEVALNAARERGFLGRDIMGSGYSVDIEIKLGAGSYLCGEELTLMESLEGRRGYPRIKPPFPAEKGLFGMPTLINNVETLATIPAIILNGSEWYMGFGTPESPGTKIFTISGDVNRPGYYETEMGIPLRALIYDLAGGIRDGLPLKAVLLGGAAGTFVDETVLDTPMGFDSLKEKGAILGSGAVMVLAEDKSMHQMTRSILEFFKHESCGKCVPCRVGTDRLVRMMREHIDSGDKKSPSLNEMVKEAEYIAANSLCPLGQSPILPLRSLQRYFSDHF